MTYLMAWSGTYSGTSFACGALRRCNLDCSAVRLTPQLDFRPFSGVIPPSFGNGAEITRLRRRAAEYVPIGDPVRGFVPVGNPVAAGAYDAVQGAAGGDQRRARAGGDDGFDQRVDRRVGDAGEIVGPFERRGLGREKRAQRIPGRGGKAEAIDGDIEIEAVATGAILHGIDDAQTGIDAERFQIPDERHVMRFE